MIKSKPAALPSCCVPTHSLIAIVAYTVEVTMPATPPAFSSGESATLRLPLSIINNDALSIHAAERLRGRAVPCLFFQLNRALGSDWAAWGRGGKWKFGPPAGRLCAGLFAHIKQY